MAILALILFVLVCIVILQGYPVAFSLAGASLLFAFAGITFGFFDSSFLGFIPSRIYGVMTKEMLIAVPLFIFMGVTMEKAKIAEELLETMALAFGQIKGGMGYSVIIVGAILAASTGIVGATVVTMGLISLPAMIKRGCSAQLSSGLICAAGTLGQIIPPSIILVILGEVMSTAFQQSQLKMGIFSPEAISVGDLFLGALGPGFLLVICYLVFTAIKAYVQPDSLPSTDKAERIAQRGDHFYWRVVKVLIPPFLMILAVLGSIVTGVATPTEAASVGAVGSIIIALMRRQLNLARLKEIMSETTKVTTMVFTIFIAASIFSVVFLGVGGDEAVHHLLTQLPGGKWTALICVMLLMFLLGFILDFIEITLVVVPIVGPILLIMGFDPVWLGIMIALNLQTSFLTPPFGFALFYLRGVAPPQVLTTDIYKGVIPFIGIQILVIVLLALWPSLATWLPDYIYG